MKQGSTGLTVRELQAYHKAIVELTPKQVNLWVEQLPAANLSDSSRHTYRLLVDLNQSILDPDVRNSILKIIAPLTQKLVGSLEKQFINNHISLTDKQKKIAALVQAIQTELSICCHGIIESIIVNDVTRSSKKLLARTIARAISYHSLVILRCYKLYASVPSRIWREIYILYQLARSFDIETKEFKDSNKQTYSVKSYFAQVMLLSIANPYQLRQGEIELLWEMLPNYTSLCSIEAHAYNKHPFLINLNSNNPPVQKSLYRKKDDEKCLKISVVGVIEQLKLDLSQVQEKAKFSARKTMVFKHLIHRWGQGTQRSFARTNCEEEIQVSIGLGATHYLLSENIQMRQTQNANLSSEDVTDSSQAIDAMEGSLKDVTLSVVATEKDNVRVKANRNYLSTSAITSKDVWAKLYQPGGQASTQPEHEKQVSKRSRDSIVRDSYKIQNCQLVNMSPGGYCLQIPSSELPKHAQTGEIIGFIEGDLSNPQWSIGVVRWVRRKVKTSHIQMGVQLLAPDASPINVQLRNSRSETNNYQRALMLPALTGVGQEASIITNPLAFNINNKLRVNEGANKYEVRLTKEINSSGSSRQFCFDKIGETQEIKKKPKRSLEPGNIDGVWDLI